MFRNRLASFGMVLVGALTALAGVAPGAVAAQGLPAVAGSPANDLAYVDNRSDAVNTLISYFNAINRQEYSRAYGYWEAGAPVGPFAQFVAGFATTQSIMLTTGQVGVSAGAGQRYFVVPVTLLSSTSGGQQTFVGCYVLHLGLPELQAAPPFQPIALHSATIVQVTGGANADSLRAQACAAAGISGTSPVTIAGLPGAPESGAQFYIDSRSSALEVIQSLFNAINRQEYARAYGYWEASNLLPAFSAFQQGYANTQSVQWTFGTVTSNAGAGQVYYSVPATVWAQTTSGLQTFVGCYVLHLANPSIQSQPPFQPIGIQSGSLSQVVNNANTTSLMANACQNVPPVPQPQPAIVPNHISFEIGATSATVGGSLAGSGLQDYTLFAGAGQWLFVDFLTGQPNVYAQVWGPSGQFVGQSNPGSTHWQGLLPATGQYTIRVISTGAATGYSLTVTIPRRIRFAPRAFSAIQPGVVIGGGLTSYVLWAAAGQTMSAALNPNAGGVFLEIYDLTAGQYVQSVGAGATAWSGRLPSSGDYLVRAVSTGPAAAFNLSVTIY